MIKQSLASKKGASSILVILLLVVLLVFGIAALTTALSNMRLGQKVAAWNNSYYAVEGAASVRFAEIDKAVALACEDKANPAVAECLAQLDFETTVEGSGGMVEIYYETWDDDHSMGIAATLALNPSDPDSLRIVQWEEIQ